jgi:hypothetical protein
MTVRNLRLKWTLAYGPNARLHSLRDSCRFKRGETSLPR